MKKDAYFIVENLKKTWQNADSALPRYRFFLLIRADALCCRAVRFWQVDYFAYYFWDLPFEKARALFSMGRITTLSQGGYWDGFSKPNTFSSYASGR